MHVDTPPRRSLHALIVHGRKKQQTRAMQTKDIPIRWQLLCVRFVAEESQPICPPYSPLRKLPRAQHAANPAVRLVGSVPTCRVITPNQSAQSLFSLACPSIAPSIHAVLAKHARHRAPTLAYALSYSHPSLPSLPGEHATHCWSLRHGTPLEPLHRRYATY